MSTMICINKQKTIWLMLDASIDIPKIEHGLSNIKQPSQGYYAITDVMDFIEKERADA